jgi:hypothetical protein
MMKASMLAVLLAAAPISSACMHTSAMSAEVRDRLAIRRATRAPARFEPQNRALRLTPGDTIAGPGCVSPMVDPRDGTEVRFVFSTSYGDYEVPAGRYGVGAGELLRLDCNTGRVIGLVRR